MDKRLLTLKNRLLPHARGAHDLPFDQRPCGRPSDHALIAIHLSIPAGKCSGSKITYAASAVHAQRNTLE
jgi:hypothetical protein